MSPEVPEMYEEWIAPGMPPQYVHVDDHSARANWQGWWCTYWTADRETLARLHLEPQPRLLRPKPRA